MKSCSNTVATGWEATSEDFLVEKAADIQIPLHDIPPKTYSLTLYS